MTVGQLLLIGTAFAVALAHFFMRGILEEFTTFGETLMKRADGPWL